MNIEQSTIHGLIRSASDPTVLHPLAACEQQAALFVPIPKGDDMRKHKYKCTDGDCKAEGILKVKQGHEVTGDVICPKYGATMERRRKPREIKPTSSEMTTCSITEMG